MSINKPDYSAKGTFTMSTTQQTKLENRWQGMKASHWAYESTGLSIATIAVIVAAIAIGLALEGNGIQQIFASIVKGV